MRFKEEIQPIWSAERKDAIAKENFLKLVRDFGDKVSYIITEVAEGKATDITIEELKNKQKYTKEQIKEAINAETYSRAGEILERLQRSNDTSGDKTERVLASEGFEKRSDEVQRINTVADENVGRVPGGGNGGRQGEVTPENPDGWGANNKVVSRDVYEVLMMQLFMEKS